MLSLNDKKWGAIQVDSFADVKSGRDIYASQRLDGDRPYVTAGTANNGIGYFVSNNNDSLDSHVISVNRNGAVGEAFFHPYKALFGNDCRRLKIREEISDDVQQFITVSIKGQKNAFSYSRKLGTERLRNLNIMVPVDDDGKPDYEYMKQYTKKVREAKLKKYRENIQERLEELGDYTEIPSLEDKEWKPIPIIDIFKNLVPGKISNASAFEKTNQSGVEYIAATNRNNGCLYFLKNTTELEKKIQPGNCIGFIKDGDGAAGYAIYKSESFVSTVNVIYGYADWLNKYTGLFFVTAQDMIEAKYSHGYKRNKEHLKGDKVMLPVDTMGVPDYEYMEQYTKNMMIRKYQQYLIYLSAEK